MNTNTYLGMLAYAFFLAFIFLIVVVLMNLLNGLAVSDTNDIKGKAEIYSYISRVETISYMESVLLGDPFDFLSNVPVYLASLPSGSLLRQMYRNPCCRKVISKLGAKSFLLFYNYLPNKQVTISPNAVSNCCQISSDQMGREIIRAAKDIVARKRKEETAFEEDQLRKELRELRSRMAQMDEMSRKLDQLLQRR